MPPMAEYKGGSGAIAPFGPVAVRVHPLTRFGHHPDGYPILIVHVELRDGWGESVKALGDLEVQLFGPATPGGGGPEVQHLVWDVDLSTVRSHLRHWDRATRTYRVQLRDVPAWMVEAMSSERPDPLTRFTIRVVFTMRDDEDKDVVLKDELELRP